MNKLFTKDNLFFIISILLVVCLTWGYIQYRKLEAKLAQYEAMYNTQEKPLYAVGDKIPTIKGVALDGNIKQYPKNEKKQKLLVFSSSDCPYCEAYLPTLDSIAKKENVSVVVLQANSSSDLNSKLIKENNYSFDMASVKDSIFEIHKVYYTPTTFILNEDYSLKHQFNVGLDYASIKEMLN